MAANSQSGSVIDCNNEYADEGGTGIEASDLATLLIRFEEATSSDDLNVPRPVHKAKWNLMRAKSAGNSPAVTPPATPPPTGPILLKTFTQVCPVKGQTLPVQFSMANPTAASTHRSNPSSSNFQPHFSVTRLSKNPSLPTQPRVNIQISNPSAPSLSVVSSLSGKSLLSKSNSSGAVSPIIINQTPAHKSLSGSAPIVITTAESQQAGKVIKIPFRDEAKDCVETFSPSGVSLVTTSTTRTFNVLRMPALDAASSYNSPLVTTKQSIPKKRSLLLPNAIEISKKKKMDVSVSLVSCSASPTTPVSLQLPHSSQPSALTRTQQELPPLRLVTGRSILSDIITKGSASYTDHKTNFNSEQLGVSKPKRMQLQKDEHTYCWSGPCFNNKTTVRSILSASVTDSSQDAMELNSEGREEIFSQTSLGNEEMVLEEGEIFVDSNGNDLFSKGTVKSCLPNEQFCSQTKVDEEVSNKVAFFDTADDTVVRRGRKYRKPVELRNSPVREDSTDFYDKIPSYYTALSIPTKQIRKTVYESVSKTLGSQDHLALSSEFAIKEEEDEGQYNKVPIHHRIFTNTSQEFELVKNSDPSCAQIEEAEDTSRQSRVRRLSSTSRISGHSASSHRSNRSGSRHSYGDRSSRSRSRSPAGSNRSQAEPRRSRPFTRRRNSSSQLSASSSSSGSSNSYCSTCGASLSRSRSRSFSSDRSRSYSSSCDSRSRSRSPREKFRRRRTFSGRSSSPEYRSRSRSPTRRRRNSYRTSSRSRRHQLKERSSAERKVMEQRKQREEEKIRAMEERRVLYVGKIPDNYTKHQMRKRFESFGEIKGVRLNFRVHGDNYGFVTFAYACDAFAAKEKGNSAADQPKFDLCFGGRRRFCPDKYADLDGNREVEEEYAPMQGSHTSGELDYAALLKQHVNAQRKRNR